jgi:hypothetical protein
MTHGLITTKLKRNAVLNQFIALSLTLKYSPALVDTGAKVNH